MFGLITESWGLLLVIYMVDTSTSEAIPAVMFQVFCNTAIESAAADKERT